jgi:membrane protein YqaA with SNARE-associated domain
MAIIHDLYNWVLGWSDSPYGMWALFLLAFAESSVFPIPPDVLLMALTLGEPNLGMVFAGLATAGSVLGGIFGYMIGYFGGRPLLERWVAAGTITRIHSSFERYEAWAIGIAGFTPIPYKIFTLSAGAFDINFPKFVLVSVLSRGARFFMVAGALQLFGPGFKVFIEKHFNLLTIVFILVLIGGFLIVKSYARRHSSGGDTAGKIRGN